MAVAEGRRLSLRSRKRRRQALQEFLKLPLLVVVAWLVCAGLVVAFDRGLLGGRQPVADTLEAVITPQATTALLTSIVPGLITLNSIVFFVLVMAVQHQSSSYSPVVFDQFLRRRGNQAFFGVLVGETMYSVIVLTLIPTGHSEMSGTVTLAGIVVTLIMLLAFIYSTVDQMRPSAIVWMIQRLALEARACQQPLLARCRTTPQLTDVPEIPVRSDAPGYIVDIDGRRLDRALSALPDDAEVEIEFRKVMGDHLVPGGVIAYVRAAEQETREYLADELGAALTTGRMPDVDRDAAHAVDQLGNIAWSAASSRDPEGARVAVRTLHSLLAHWGEQPHPDPEQYGGTLPVVYTDRIVRKILDALTGVIAAARPTSQHQTYSYALRGLAEVLPRLDPDDQRAAVDRLHRVLSMAAQQLFTQEVEGAFNQVQEALDAVGLESDRDRVAEIKAELVQQHRLAQPGDGGWAASVAPTEP